MCGWVGLGGVWVVWDPRIPPPSVWVAELLQGALPPCGADPKMLIPFIMTCGPEAIILGSSRPTLPEAEGQFVGLTWHPHGKGKDAKLSEGQAHLGGLGGSGPVLIGWALSRPALAPTALCRRSFYVAQSFVCVSVKVAFISFFFNFGNRTLRKCFGDRFDNDMRMV